KFSPDSGRRTAGLAQIFDTLKAASGGLPQGQVQQLLKAVTQPVRGYCSQLIQFPKVLPGSEDLGTRPQLHQPRRSQSPPNHPNVDEKRAKVNENQLRTRFR